LAAMRALSQIEFFNRIQRLLSLGRHGRIHAVGHLPVTALLGSWSDERPVQVTLQPAGHVTAETASGTSDDRTTQRRFTKASMTRQ
jgi:hypothetical protein